MTRANERFEAFCNKMLDDAPRLFQGTGLIAPIIVIGGIVILIQEIYRSMRNRRDSAKHFPTDFFYYYPRDTIDIQEEIR